MFNFNSSNYFFRLSIIDLISYIDEQKFYSPCYLFLSISIFLHISLSIFLYISPVSLSLSITLFIYRSIFLFLYISFFSLFLSLFCLSIILSLFILIFFLDIDQIKRNKLQLFILFIIMKIVLVKRTKYINKLLGAENWHDLVLGYNLTFTFLSIYHI